MARQKSTPKTMLEHDIQNAIRLRLAELGGNVIWRANVGMAWTGREVKRVGGNLVISDPRPFTTGLPAGFCDLFGFKMVKITPEMAGRELPVFTAIEVKQPGKLPRLDQQAFMGFLREKNCLVGIARSPEEAVEILRADR